MAHESSSVDAEAVRDSVLALWPNLIWRWAVAREAIIEVKAGARVPRPTISTSTSTTRPIIAAASIRFIFRTIPDPFMSALDCRTVLTGTKANHINYGAAGMAMQK